ncbi:hypothetical protein BaRGS_00015229 [Batillaria attramentaria]|uniref:Uncharacterized protein n=1 Tax=Batillaria attramentaria TaxID=370345 RepID=A0ABD0L2S0_9CAEN
MMLTWWWMGLLLLSPEVGGQWSWDWCAPKLWEGKSWTVRLTHTDQGIEFSEMYRDFSLDAIGARLAWKETGVRNGQEYSATYLAYYPANTLFKVENGVCTSSYIQGNVSNCKTIPNDHITEFMAKTVIGGGYGSDNIIPIFAAGRVDSGVGEFYMTEMDGYFPLMDEVRGSLDEGPTYEVTYYYNATIGIQDPTVFVPPEICEKAARRTS